MNVNALFLSAVQTDVIAAYDAAEAALRAAEKDAPALAPRLREAVDALFAARVAIDEARS